MLRLSTLAQALNGITGWRTLAGDTGLELSAPLKESRSGLYINDLNELLQLPILNHCKPRLESLSDWLTRVQGDAVLKLVGDLVQAQGLSGKTLLQDTPFVKGLGQRANTVNKLGRFVGFKVDLRAYSGVAYFISRLSLQLNMVSAEPVPIYVYRSDEPEAVRVLNLQNDRANFPTWIDLPLPETTVPGDPQPLDLSFADTVGVTAFIGYYEDDLGAARAITKEFSGGPCGCEGYDPYNEFKNYAWPRAISVPSEALEEDRSLFDVDRVQVENQSFGLNLELLGYCDVATALSTEENQARIAPLVQLAIGIRLLDAIMGSPNITQVTQRQDIQADARAYRYTYQAQLYGGKDLGTENDYYPSKLKNTELDLSLFDAVCQAPKRDRISAASLNQGGRRELPCC